MAAAPAAAEQHAPPEEVGGLKPADLGALLKEAPSESVDEAPAALAPYLSAPAGLSKEAYEEWLARVCEQPAD